MATKNAYRALEQITDSIRWYWKDLSPNLSLEDKGHLLKDLLKYRFEERVRGRDVPSERFPLIGKYWPRGTLTNLELSHIAGEIYKELDWEGVFDG